MAYLALQAQNDAYNMQANRVYKETGQPLRPPDTRTTTEKMADLEEVRVNLLMQMREMMDGTNALEAISMMTPNEIEFTYQSFGLIKSELEQRFTQGVPAVAFVSYVRALIAREMATSGVSFPMQEATSRALLDALVAGRQQGAPIAQLAPPTATAIEAQPVVEASVFDQRGARVLDTESAFLDASWPEVMAWFKSIRPIIPDDYMQELVDQGLIARKGEHAGFLREEISKKVAGMEKKLTAAEAKRMLLELFRYTSSLPMTPPGAKDPAQPMSKGSGIMLLPGVRQRSQPATLIHGWGLSRALARAPRVSVDVTKGVRCISPTFVPFGKYIVDPAKLSRGQLDLRTLRGGKVGRYPYREISQPLTKILKRILEDRMPDEHDIRELDLDDQELVFNLARDANINDRLNIPSPKLSKENQTLNRFEILKGQIIAGNDGTEVVKEFKTLLVKLSDEGVLKKSEARDILMTLASMGR